MKTIIAGSREITDYELLERVIKKSGYKITEVVWGGAPGVDALGKKWAEKNNIPIKPFPADWKNISVPGAVVKYRNEKPYNVLAGFMRNQQMADYADCAIVIHIKTKGSMDMVERMRKLGKDVFEVILKEQMEIEL